MQIDISRSLVVKIEYKQLLSSIIIIRLIFNHNYIYNYFILRKLKKLVIPKIGYSQLASPLEI